MVYDFLTMDKHELIDIIRANVENVSKELLDDAMSVKERQFGRGVYVRGLIEFSNYCGNNCNYCSIRRDNRNINRYRLSGSEILNCCDNGYALGFRTFVLQSGDDPFYSDDTICNIITLH